MSISLTLKDYVNYPDLKDEACGSAPQLTVAEVVSIPSTSGWLTSGGYPYPLTMGREQPRGIPCRSASQYTEPSLRISTIISKHDSGLGDLAVPSQILHNNTVYKKLISLLPNSFHSLGRRPLNTKVETEVKAWLKNSL
jgi:hypothetical protein